MPSVSNPPDGASFCADSLRYAELADLLHAAARGDAESFEKFYLRTIRLSGAVIYKLTGGTHVEDVLSESYFQAWRQVKRFDAQRGNALAWLLNIARSRALDRLRIERSRHGGLEGAPEALDDDVQHSDTPGPDTSLECRQSHGQLQHALGTLSASERWVVGLAYYSEMSHMEIAGCTKFPLGTVKSMLSRSRRVLRQSIETQSLPRQQPPPHP